MLIAVNRHVTFHRSEDAGLEIRRLELRIGFEMEQNVASLRPCIRPDEGVGQDLQKFSGLLIIMLTAPAPFSLRARVMDEGAHLLALLRFGESLPVAFNYAIDTHRIGFGDPLLDGLTGLAIYLEIKPVGVVIAACGEFSLNGLPNDVAGTLSGAERELQPKELRT